MEPATPVVDSMPLLDNMMAPLDPIVDGMPLLDPVIDSMEPSDKTSSFAAKTRLLALILPATVKEPDIEVNERAVLLSSSVLISPPIKISPSLIISIRLFSGAK